MSVYTDLYRGKVQRFKVTHRGRAHYVNTTSMDSALAMVRTKLIGELRNTTLAEPNPALATFEDFKAASGVGPSLRY